MLSALGAKEEWLEIRQSGAECSVGVAKPETLVFATVSLRDAVETAVLKQFLYKAVFEGIFEAVKSFAWRVCEQTRHTEGAEGEAGAAGCGASRGDEDGMAGD